MAYKRKSPMPEIEGGTNQLTYTTGDILYASASNTLSKLAVGSNAEVLTLAAGIPSWAANGGGDVVGPASATDNALARFDGTTGKLLQNSTVIVTDAGEMTNASQPEFIAYVSANILNVTGDATSYDPVIFNTELSDQGSDYNTTTGIFTAPISGIYSFFSTLSLGGLTSSHNAMDNIIGVVGIANYVGPKVNAGAARNSVNELTVGNSSLIILDAADTVQVFLNVGGGTKVVDVLGDSNPITRFSGKLVC
jgi:hypothetical protein